MASLIEVASLVPQRCFRQHINLAHGDLIKELITHIIPSNNTDLSAISIEQIKREELSFTTSVGIAANVTLLSNASFHSPAVLIRVQGGNRSELNGSFIASDSTASSRAVLRCHATATILLLLLLLVVGWGHLRSAIRIGSRRGSIRPSGRCCGWGAIRIGRRGTIS